MQGRLEAQVGAVTGGTRGQKLPKAVRDALDEISSARGPRGKFKDVMDRLDDIDGKIAEFETKGRHVFQLTEDLTRNRRELKEAQAGWDEEAHHAEIDGERSKRTAAATREAEIAGARSAARLARERATNARQMVHNRAKAIAELEPLEFQLKKLDAEAAGAITARTNAKSSADAGEKKLAELRAQGSRNAERTRMLERVRAVVSLNSEIKQHQLTLEKSATLENEATRLSEMIGSIGATDDAVTRIEEAVTEMSAAEAAPPSSRGARLLS